jgi:hypothetical protein
MKNISFFDVVAAMKYRKVLTLWNKERVSIQAIELESGSGTTWNVTVQNITTNKRETIFWDESNGAKFFN